MLRSELYQLFLILLLVVTTLLFGVFMYREVFPEYKVFQEAYVELEEFRSSITGVAPAPFSIGVKQIVLPQGNGPEIIDRCTSCHVALQLQHFSPSKIALDINGEVILDELGTPVKVPNEDYVWKLVDEKIDMLVQQGSSDSLAEAENLRSLKTVMVDGHAVDMTKVLAMHPLIGKETRPFEFHPIEDYGCTVCHSGNGRAITMEKAHGPVFDGQYEEAYEGPRPEFLELDPDNDPVFSRVFNHKPGHHLLFQTTPLFPGGLIEANCVQCHLTSISQLQEAASTVKQLKEQTAGVAKDVTQALEEEMRSLISLIRIKQQLKAQGYDKVVAQLRSTVEDYTQPEMERNRAQAQLTYLQREGADKIALKLNNDIAASVGSSELAQALEEALSDPEANVNTTLEAFVQANNGSDGALFKKIKAANSQKTFLHHIDKADTSFSNTVNKDQIKKAITSDIDRMTHCYQRGEELFISQACYACHRIAGFARGGVGPELTWEGNSYPWFVKESIVWPQADLKTSTMPNYRLDHEEVESLVCFLMAQKGKPQSVSHVEYQMALKQWEEGKRRSWESAVEPSQIHDLRFGMTVFATEGCAACHRLKGFESNVGYAVEKGREASFDEVYREHLWFTSMIPELATGSDIVRAVSENQQEIDRRIVDDVREDSILEHIEKEHPQAIESFYSPFRFALRAKNHELEERAKAAKTFDEKAAAERELAEWKARVRRVMMMFVQEYGLGRLVGPRPNWSGIYRSDEWLIEHFYNPGGHVARSIMPVFPFDETKFYSLVYMLDMLAHQNAQNTRKIWDNRGFNPELAYDIHCAQCHGNFRQGDGPIAEWIYPIPKNLRNTSFLWNLTREKAVESIVHGIKGGPMPPWGEVAKDKPFKNTVPVLRRSEVERLVDWLYLNLPRESQQQLEPLKWRYQPEDVIKELDQEGDVLQGSLPLPRGSQYLAALPPQPTQTDEQTRVSEVFDIRPYPVAGVDRKAYYIKDKYYTENNIAEGQRLFIENCAVCHGKEGAGTGLRAGTMVEAKPRMLTNLDWIATHDDLRLLQSIKYGVPGTSMVAWGDATSTLQRLQLVIFIRSLSQEHILREHLAELLYQSFDRQIQTIRQARIEEHHLLRTLNEQYRAAEEEKEELDVKLLTDKTAAAQAVEAYQKQVELAAQLQLQTEVDQSIKNLIDEVKHQRDRYAAIATAMLTTLGDTPLVSSMINLVSENAITYQYQDGKLLIDPESAAPKAIVASGKKIITDLDLQIENMQKQLSLMQAGLPSADRYERSSDLKQRIGSITQLRNQLITTLEDAARSRIKQEHLLKEINYDIQKAHGSKSQK